MGYLEEVMYNLIAKISTFLSFLSTYGNSIMEVSDRLRYFKLNNLPIDLDNLVMPRLPDKSKTFKAHM